MLLMNDRNMKTYKFLAVFLLGLLIGLLPHPGYSYSLWNAPTNQSQNYLFWYKLRGSFRLNHYNYNEKVRQQIYWFKQHQADLNHVLAKAAPYMYYIFEQVRTHNLPGELVLLPVVESAYDPFAYSDRGAAGLWQLMPHTASSYGLKEDWWYDGRRDIYASTKAALSYLARLQNYFNGNWLYAIASYNAGEGTVESAIQYNIALKQDTSFWNLLLPNQTNCYVFRVLALAAIISNPQEFGITLPTLRSASRFEKVNVGTQIDLETAAKLAGISVDELYKLNPGYNRWATDPNGPFWLLLPADKVDAFNTNLANLPPQYFVTWNRYEVKSGDSLSKIADTYRTRIALLQKINKLKSDLLRPGEILLIPKRSPSLAIRENHKNRYKVRRGDNLSAIASNYHVSVHDLKTWNEARLTKYLRPGQTLVVYQ